MIPVLLLVLVCGVGFGVGFPMIYYSGAIRKRDQEITALKIGRAETFERLRGAEDREVAQRNRAAEWHRLAVEESGRVRELTDRLLLVGKIPEIDDGSEPMSVADADRLAADEARREHEALLARRPKQPAPGMEPIAISDDEVPPVPRLDADSEGEGDEDEEDTSFAARMR